MDHQSAAARQFAEAWAGKGDEKQDSQRFWMELLQTVYGVENPAAFVRFETKVRLSHQSYIDVMIPATHTLIEQKGRTVDLEKPIRQSDGTFLKPAEQAKRYAAALPYSDRPRWIIVSNFHQFQVFNMQEPNAAPAIVELADLEKEYYRLQFMVDVRDSHITKEMELSKEAGALVGKIYDALLPCYGARPTAKDLQDLNKLIVRLVFCLYAEDAVLFGRRNQFHDYLAGFAPQHLQRAIRDLFRVLDTPVESRDRFLEGDLAVFPYVNGSLFTEEIPIPPMSEKVRELILGEACDFDWSSISPTIFGAIFESTLNPETRRAGGMHYTSIENIHKVIDPLFLDAYKEKFRAAMEIPQEKPRKRALEALQTELASGRYFDPAAGSGNFLTESYLSLRRLENDILRETVTDSAGTGILGFAADTLNPIKVSIQQFYGIEINDFAVSVARTALWIAEAQMMAETEDIIHKDIDFLPLHSYTNIHEGNALRMDWKDVLEPGDEVRIMGNPPFVGYSYQTGEQKADLSALTKAKNVDYVSGWYIKAAQYMADKQVKAAFVSTNSICQGEQVVSVWKPLTEEHGIHINFAYPTFKWQSEAMDQAAVHVIIVGFSKNVFDTPRRIFTSSDILESENISPYLLEAPTVFIEKRKTPLCDVPAIYRGNQPTDNGNLILTKEEKDALIQKEPACQSFIRPFMMGSDFINRKTRYCLWMVGVTPKEIRKYPEVMKRIENVRTFRLASTKAATRRKADTPMLFDEVKPNDTDYIAIPKVSSEKRRYIPMDYLSKEVIPGDMLFVMPESTLYHFGILMSNVHMAWMRVIAGRLKSDYRYSNTNVYNTFPWPTPTDAQKSAIEKTAQGILDACAKYPDSSLADLYDEVTMPAELRAAHRANDKAVMAAYGFPIKMTESECVAALMKLYLSLCK